MQGRSSELCILAEIPALACVSLEPERLCTGYPGEHSLACVVAGLRGCVYMETSLYSAATCQRSAVQFPGYSYMQSTEQ